MWVSANSRQFRFLSTPSARRAPRALWRSPCSSRFLSTPSARRATGGAGLLRLNGIISIHALREEGDVWATTENPSAGHFYPRPPRGGRLMTFEDLLDIQQFLSTPSARRATC